jgi:hypothetical protein
MSVLAPSTVPRQVDTKLGGAVANYYCCSHPGSYWLAPTVPPRCPEARPAARS